jgi:hypothetical protein
MGYNIAQPRNISLSALIIFCTQFNSFARNKTIDTPPLKVISTIAEYRESATKDENMKILKNRKLLKETMEKYMFKEFATGWWHYSLPDPEKYDVMDLSFEELKKE